jgi:two-component system NtrC family response regulator
MRLLIVDSSTVARRQLFVPLRTVHQVQEAASREEALALLERAAPEVILADPFEPGDPDENPALAWVQRVRNHTPRPFILIITRNDRKDVVARLLRLGVLDVLPKPADADEIRLHLRRAERLRELGLALSEPAAPADEMVADGDGLVLRSRPRDTPLPELGIVGQDRRIRQIVDQIKRIAATPVSVLITGETGTGKEIFAQAVHRLSGRRDQRFVALNCAVLSDSLVEDELFGHEKGAFTGATDRRKGKFEYADRGSLFLDEIGELSLPLQSKFLRVLQERSFERLGGNQPIATDFRLISATHRELPRLIKDGFFREDLMFRINVVSFHIPPLRERPGDILSLAHHFLKEYGRAFGRGEGLTLSREVERYLLSYPWPGNVRELRHFVERAVALSDGDHIGPEAMPADFSPSAEGPPLQEGLGYDSGTLRHGGAFDTLVKRYKRQLLAEALETAGQDKARAAELLGLSRSQVFKLVKELGVPTVRPGAAARPRPRSTAAS